MDASSKRNDSGIKPSSGNKTEDSMTTRTQGWEARTLSASGRPPQRTQTVEEYRRAQADKAIARIEERYRRGHHPRRSLGARLKVSLSAIQLRIVIKLC
jgi:hypothetical protein